MKTRKKRITTQLRFKESGKEGGKIVYNQLPSYVNCFLKVIFYLCDFYIKKLTYYDNFIFDTT